MCAVLPLLLGCGLLAPAADPDKTVTYRYARADGGKPAFTAEVTLSPADGGGSTLVSRTDDGRESMTLTVHRDKDGKVTSAEATSKRGGDTRTAELTFLDKTARVKRGGLSDFLEGPADAVVATFPDWSDVLQVVRRYDAKKGGKQEFAALWLHPHDAAAATTCAADRVGADKATYKDKETALDRYRLKTHAGECRAWARPEDGVVVKIAPVEGQTGPVVVLEGWEDATHDLK
jgi:hypothetical protein